MASVASATFPDPGRRPSASRLARAEQVEHLAGVPLFASMPKRHLRRLARSTRQVTIEADQVLIAEGESSHEAYLIIAGRAVVRRKGRKLAELGPGDIVGELGLLLHRPRQATVRSTSPLEVLVLDRDDLREVVEESPELGWRLLETVAERLGEHH